MHRHYAKSLLLLVAILLTGLAPPGPQAGSELVISGYHTDGKTVFASVTNNTTSGLGGTVRATVVQNGQTHRAAARAKVPAGQTVTVSIVVGTITDDLNPLDFIYLGTIVDDINPV